MATGGPDTAGWIEVAITTIGGLAVAAWAAIKTFFSFVTRDELKTAFDKWEKGQSGLMEAMETRHKDQLEDFKETILRLHEENKVSRHDLAISLSEPILKLTSQIATLEGRFDEMKSHIRSDER